MHFRRRLHAVQQQDRLTLADRGDVLAQSWGLDDLVLAAEGVKDFGRYAVTPGGPLQQPLRRTAGYVRTDRPCRPGAACA